MIFAVDPGTFESAYVIMDKEYRPIEFDILKNEYLKMSLSSFNIGAECFVIEKPVAYRQRVGREVFETVFWTGRLFEAAKNSFTNVNTLTRQQVLSHLEVPRKKSDSLVIKKLVDRFAQHDFKSGKGTKKAPDWFYGFKADIWQAYALGVAYLDMLNKGGNKIEAV